MCVLTFICNVYNGIIDIDTDIITLINHFWGLFCLKTQLHIPLCSLKTCFRKKKTDQNDRIVSF